MISYIMNTKNCMSVLLLSDRFDSFSFIGGEITTYCTFQIDGTYHPEFFADKEDAGSEPYVRWSYVREYCLSLIKGKQTPLRFHFILSLSPDQIEALLQRADLPYRSGDIKGLYLNFRFDGTHLLCTTGTSFHTFVLDKSLEHLWDGTVMKLFASKGLEFEEHG